MPNYKPKNCELCGLEFIPTSPKQKYCVDCKHEGSLISARIRDRKRDRKEKGYTEYTKVCPFCGKTFVSYYSRKVYCGSEECERYRVHIKNRSLHERRDKDALRERTRLYYKENKNLCCLKKAEQYRESNPDAKPYVPGRIYKHDVDYVREYAESRGYKLLSDVYENNRGVITLLCPNGHEWYTNFHSFKDGGVNCYQCYVENNYVSKPEQKIRDYFETNHSELKVVYNARNVIAQRELDLYFPDQKVAVEVCCLYWHSDTANGVERSYHYDKMMACYDVGVRLITVFEDEIQNKFDLVVSRIEQALGTTQRRVYARKCQLVELKNNLARKFFDDHHIQGGCPSSAAFGLIHDGTVVAACSVGVITRGHANIGRSLELKRFCSASGCVVVGGAGKLFKRVIKYAIDNGYDNIKSYCDMRYGNIFKPVYETLGFTLHAYTKYTPHYFRRGVRYRNMSLRKTVQERLTGKSEVELRLSQGFHRIWDCGHRTYFYDLT